MLQTATMKSAIEACCDEAEQFLTEGHPRAAAVALASVSTLRMAIAPDHDPAYGKALAATAKRRQVIASHAGYEGFIWCYGTADELKYVQVAARTRWALYKFIQE